MTSSGGSDFKVDTDALTQVAKDVQNLLDDIQGKNGAYAGNMPDFAKAASITPALATFWGTNDDVFADVYAQEYAGIMATYNAMITQLTNLATAAATTAATYQTQDQASKATIGKSGGA